MSAHLQSLKFEAFGIVVEVSGPADIGEGIGRAVSESLPGSRQIVVETAIDRRFTILSGTDGYSIDSNGETLIDRADLERTLTYLGSHARLTVAENAREFIFVHSGAVVWNGRAVLLPGESYSGKTTLTAELVKRGAEYLSDEFAVIDNLGRACPFPKTLSMRGILDGHRQVEISAESLGATVAVDPVPVGTVLVSEYVQGSHFRPRAITKGDGLMALIANTVPIRASPERAIKVLGKAVAGAVFLKGKRGEATEAAEALLEQLTGR